MIQEHVEKTKNGKIDIKEYVSKAIAETKEINKEYNYMNIISEEEALKQADELSKKILNHDKPKLAGLIVSVKDNICIKDIESTAGSAILKGYYPRFDATVIKRLKDAGAIILGKTSMDEFGFGGFNLNVGLGFKIPLNPLDKERCTGGSSGGSGGITAKADFAHVSIAESTGGSIETPASFCGVVGFCPTYGRLSRFGLISYANSLDKIGILAKETSDIEPVLRVMSGKDSLDPTSIAQPLESEQDADQAAKSSFKIGIIKESLDQSTAPEVKEALDRAIGRLKEAGHTVDVVSMPITFKYGVPTYYLIATSEASTNLSKYSGLRYGQQHDPKGKTFSEYFKSIRTKYFNDESKRRIILGTFARMAGYREAFYIRATKIRTLIINEYKKQFSNYDALISPTMPILPPKIKEASSLTPIQNYMIDQLTVGPNLAGIPHASIPIGEHEGLSIGMMVMCPHYKEIKLLKILKLIESFQQKSASR